MKYKIFNLLKGKSIIIKCFSLAILFWPSIAFAQRYSFTNYSIEDGLLQSQVLRILQDNTHRLLVTTLLGMNRFDGKTFTPVTKDYGLPDSVTAETVDRAGKIWCSTLKGLYYYYADKTTRFVGPNNDSSIVANALIADNRDNIWGLRHQQLFKITAGYMQGINITGGRDTITAIELKIINGSTWCRLRSQKAPASGNLL
jgi:ligand-binding sensor domain-containing protein